MNDHPAEDEWDDPDFMTDDGGDPGQSFIAEPIHLYDERRHYAGLPVVHPDFPDEMRSVSDPGAVAWSLTFGFGDEGGCERFVDTPHATRARAIVISMWDEPTEVSSEEVIGFFAENAGRFPNLRSIFLGGMPSEVCEISWIRQADVTPLLEAYPRLERLEVKGGDGLRLRPVRHEALNVLRFESGGLPGHVVRAVGECDLPGLEHLELWLGTDGYGGDATVADLGGILSGEGLPSLRRLGLRDSEIQDQIAAAVASAPVVARLESLALSMGTLSDEGAEALLSGQPLTHLRLLDLRHHFLGEAMCERLRAALAGVQVELGEAQSSSEGDWRYVVVSE
ncbi:STM4015 family protein [Streptosporangium sp. CA-135522]|uniref:STM4015 family protein n=1 Tax=Streptosporangium sp. CA-135522 TaxID=3240072 RepID=UPI003D8A1FC2